MRLTLLEPQSRFWGQTSQIPSSLSPKTGRRSLKGQHDCDRGYIGSKKKETNFQSFPGQKLTWTCWEFFFPTDCKSDGLRIGPWREKKKTRRVYAPPSSRDNVEVHGVNFISYQVLLIVIRVLSIPGTSISIIIVIIIIVSSSLFLTPFRTAVPFWGQTTQILSSLSPKRDCGSKGDNTININTHIHNDCCL